MPCMCGATDCPSCGPAQGYPVTRAWIRGRWVYVNEDELDDDVDTDPPEEETESYLERRQAAIRIIGEGEALTWHAPKSFTRKTPCASSSTETRADQNRRPR